MVKKTAYAINIAFNTLFCFLICVLNFWSDITNRPTKMKYIDFVCSLLT